MKTLREIMRPGFIFGVQRDASVADAARTMTTNNVGIVAVFAGDRLVGVFSERDIVRRVVDRSLDPARTQVADVMTLDPRSHACGHRGQGPGDSHPARVSVPGAAGRRLAPGNPLRPVRCLGKPKRERGRRGIGLLG